VQVAEEAEEQRKAAPREQVSLSSASTEESAKASQSAASTAKRSEAKVGRNAPCPCGSGKKYKLCHGRPGAPALD
jgi:preprotein translocase subunit SecA